MNNNEKQIFIEWLRTEIYDMGILIEQMEKLPNMDSMLSHYREKVMGYSIVLIDLENRHEG